MNSTGRETPVSPAPRADSSGTPAPAERRQAQLGKLAADSFDVLVVGGGIVGAGIARDASMRGLRTALVEQHDFAFGASSRSSRLLHGGMRYLAQGRLGLVRESSVEKKVVSRIAPHLSEPLPFVFPAYRTERDWALWQLKIGVKIYDLLCSGGNLGKSTWLSPNETLQKAPGLRGSDLKGAVRYFDGFTNDARLTLDTLRSASAHGATLLNYCRFVRAENGNGWRCDAEDTLSGRPLKLRARAVINATGPWAAQLPHSRVKLRVTKGVHLVVDRSRLALPETIVMTEGKRILFAIPWGERTIIGTTDTDYDGSLEAVRVEKADIDYLLAVTGRFFPQSRLGPDDVISSWAGLRPLIASDSGKPSDISRSHQIRNPEPGWWDVAGGKLTTYRLMAEQTVNRVIKWLKRDAGFDRAPGPCRTASEPLLPGGHRVNGSGIRPPPVSEELVRHYCEHEWAVHIDDVMSRRTSWQTYLANAPAVAERVARWMAAECGWTESQLQAELKRYHAITSLAVQHSLNS